MKLKIDCMTWVSRIRSLWLIHNMYWKEHSKSTVLNNMYWKEHSESTVLSETMDGRKNASRLSTYTLFTSNGCNFAEELVEACLIVEGNGEYG